MPISIDTLICTLERWQTLAGSIIGGLFALAIAWFVASRSKQHAELTSATLLSSDLTQLAAAASNLRQRLNDKKGSEDKRKIELAQYLLTDRPRLAEVFESSVVTLMVVDKYLAAHLYLLKMLYRDVEDKLIRLEQADKDFRKTGKSSLTDENLKGYINLIWSGFWLIAEHVEYAQFLIRKLVLNRSRILYRLVRLVWPASEERKGRDLLRSGGI